MKIGFIKDAFGGIPHVMATMSGDEIELKTITEFGKSIVSDFDFDVKDIANTIPVGFMFTGFIGEKAENNVAPHVSSKTFSYVGSVKENFVPNPRNAIGVSISKFSNTIDKINAVSFKASAFKTATRKSEFQRRINSGKVIFDEQLRKTALNPKFAFSHVENELLHGSFSEGFIRRTAEKTAKPKAEKRRAARRSRALEELSSGDEKTKKMSFLARIEKAKKEVKNGR